MVRLNGKELTIGLLVDEFLHVWNRGRKGQFLPENLAELHRFIADYTYEVGTRRLNKIHNSLEDIYHHLELVNFLNSGRRLPNFF